MSFVVVKVGIQVRYLPILMPPSRGAVIVMGAVLSVGASALRPPGVPTKTKRIGACLRARAENIEDDLLTIGHGDAGEGFPIPLLRRAQGIVEDEHIAQRRQCAQ